MCIKKLDFATIETLQANIKRFTLRAKAYYFIQRRQLCKIMTKNIAFLLEGHILTTDIWHNISTVTGFYDIFFLFNYVSI